MTHRDKLFEKYRMQRDRRLHVQGRFTELQFRRLLRKYDYRCFYCGCDLRKLPKGQLHRDHFVPLSKGGTDYISNIVPSCASCNMKKGNKMPEVFLLEIWGI